MTTTNKDTHEMTRLELEVELTNARKIIKDLQETIKKQQFIINTYGDYIDNFENKKVKRRIKDE